MSCDRNTSQESWSNVDLEDPFLYLHLVLCGSGPGPRAEGAVCGSGSTPQKPRWKPLKRFPGLTVENLILPAEASVQTSVDFADSCVHRFFTVGGV